MNVDNKLSHLAFLRVEGEISNLCHQSKQVIQTTVRSDRLRIRLLPMEGKWYHQKLIKKDDMNKELLDEYTSSEIGENINERTCGSEGVSSYSDRAHNTAARYVDSPANDLF